MLRHFKRCSGVLICIAAMLTALGCDDETIRSYEAPKDPPSTASQPPLPSAPPPASPAAATKATWVKPPDWRLDPKPSSFAIASFLAGPDDRPARITLTRFPGDGGGVLANINRWRGQMNLPPVASIDQQPTTPMALDNVPGMLVDLVPEAEYGSDPNRTVGLMAFGAQECWFVKMTGPSSVVDQARPAFDAFVASIRLPQPDAAQP